MQTTKRMLAAGLMAAAFLVVPMGSVGAAPLDRVAMMGTTDVATVYRAPREPGTIAPPSSTTRKPMQKINSGSTGDAELDALCQQAADLINDAIRQRDMAENAGDINGGQAWHDLAIDMTGRAKEWGCNFTQASVRGAGNGPANAGNARR